MVSMSPENARAIAHELLTTSGVQKYLREHGIERSTDSIRLYERAGRLPAVRVGPEPDDQRFKRAQQRLFHVADVDRLASELIAELAERIAS